MRYSEGMDTTGVSDLASAGLEGTRTNQGSHIIYITGETCALASSEHTSFGILVKASLLMLTCWFHIHLFLFIYGSIMTTFPRRILDDYYVFVYTKY